MHRLTFVLFSLLVKPGFREGAYVPAVAATTTVLIVDDEPQLLRLLVRIFERRGYQVLSAVDADEAGEVFERHHCVIDAAVLDVVIPPAGVDPLLSRMRELRDDIGVVLTSGDELPLALAERLEARGGVFLRKPFSPAAAVAALRQVARRETDG